MNKTDICAACGTDLGTCDTIWAADGNLYCSQECGEYSYSMIRNILADEAKRLFDNEAEEINPTDIGIIRRTC